IGDACSEAQNHVNALIGKDDAESAARPGFTKQTTETAPAAEPAVAPIATLEKDIVELRAEMQSNMQELGQALTNLAEAVAKLTGDDRSRPARAAVPVITVKKEDDGKPEQEEGRSVHELLKQALQKPQRASYYLR